MTWILHSEFRTKHIAKILEKERISRQEKAKKLDQIKQIYIKWKENHQSISYEVKEKQKRRISAFFINQTKNRFIRAKSRRIFDDEDQEESQDAYEKYISESIFRCSNSLKWWTQKNQTLRWSDLSQFAIHILSIVSMSTASEQIFSTSRRTISWNRAQLSSSVIETIECSKHYLIEQKKQ
jgi:hAT family C-terminal dimerisation region